MMLAGADHREVLACRDAALAIDPGFADGHSGRAITLTVLGRHAEARRAYSTSAHAQGRHPSLSAAEAKTLQLPPAVGTRHEDVVQSGSSADGTRRRIPQLALALATRNSSTRVAEIMRQAGGQVGRGGSDNGDSLRFRYTQVYAPPNCGSSSLLAELQRLFGSAILAPEWSVFAEVCCGALLFEWVLLHHPRRLKSTHRF